MLLAPMPLQGNKSAADSMELFSDSTMDDRRMPAGQFRKSMWMGFAARGGGRSLLSAWEALVHRVRCLGFLSAVGTFPARAFSPRYRAHPRRHRSRYERRGFLSMRTLRCVSGRAFGALPPQPHGSVARRSHASPLLP